MEACGGNHPGDDAGGEREGVRQRVARSRAGTGWLSAVGTLERGRRWLGSPSPMRSLLLCPHTVPRGSNVTIQLL